MSRTAIVLVMVMGIAPSALAGPLHDAARKGDLAAIETLLAEGAKIDERATNGETSLILAILVGNDAAAELLIEKGANVMARNAGGLTPLHAAAYTGSRPVAELLLDKGAALEDRANKAGATPLLVAAEQNQVDLAEFLIARGADVSTPDENGYTPLTQAWSKKRIEMVRLLKRHGATCQPAEILGNEDYHRRCVEAGT